MKNIILIGMPGAGKSTIGVLLAKSLLMDFVDTDLLIQKKYKTSLCDIINSKGIEEFLKIENDVISSWSFLNCIIATGGSAVYGKEAMEHFRKIGTVVYLKLPYEEIAERVGDLNARGVSLMPGQTLLDLYRERTPLYEKYAHITVNCEGKMLRELVAEVEGKL